MKELSQREFLIGSVLAGAGAVAACSEPAPSGGDMDGVPGPTEDPAHPGARFTCIFTVPHAGTHWYHSHSGLQLDRGLYGPLIIDDPADPGHYDHEWIVVLDDWLDSIDGTPEDAARRLGMDAPGARGRPMPGMGHGQMGGARSGHQVMTSRLVGVAGDVHYPHYLVNGKAPADPVSWTANRGQRVEIRFINAGTDTLFRDAIGRHTMTVTHTDGFPTAPQKTEAILLGIGELGIGERVDVVVTLTDGAFLLYALCAEAEGNAGYGYALVSTRAGEQPDDLRPGAFDGPVLLAADLARAPDSRLPGREHDRYFGVDMGGTMMPYRWTLNGPSHPDTRPLEVSGDDRVRLRLRLRLRNISDMAHPHTLSLSHLRTHRQRAAQRHRHDPPHAGFRDRVRCERPRRMGLPLPQRLPPGSRSDDHLVVPRLTTTRSTHPTDLHADPKGHRPRWPVPLCSCPQP